MAAETLERELLSHYYFVRLGDDLRQEIARQVEAALTNEQAAVVQTKTRANKRLKDLDAQEDRYVDLLGDPDWPQDKIKGKLASLRHERSDLTAQLANASASLQAARSLPRPWNCSLTPMSCTGNCRTPNVA